MNNCAMKHIFIKRSSVIEILPTFLTSQAFLVHFLTSSFEHTVVWKVCMNLKSPLLCSVELHFLYAFFSPTPKLRWCSHPFSPFHPITDTSYWFGPLGLGTIRYRKEHCEQVQINLVFIQFYGYDAFSEFHNVKNLHELVKHRNSCYV